ncbi:MAG: hypothetical protein Q4F31_01910 [Eubacteriales bacterium]|nr:hypothetical protein [Eubacteriales bacterium]
MEVTIDLKDLWKKIAEKWMVLLILAVIGAVLLNIIAVGRASASAYASEELHRLYSEAAPELPSYYNEEMYSIRSSLSENDALFCEAYAKVYKDYISEFKADSLTEDSTRLEAYMMFLDSYKDVLSVFSGQQRAYYNALILTNTESSEIGASVSEYVPEKVGKIQIKWIVLGIAAGVLAGCVLIIVPYLMTKKLRNAKDIEVSFNVPLLATVEKSGGGEAQLEFISTGISVLMKNSEAASLILSGAASPDASSFRMALSEKLTELGIKNVVSDILSDDSETVTNLGDASVVVFVEKTAFSRYENINAEIVKCSQYAVKPIGCVVLE